MLSGHENGQNLEAAEVRRGDINVFQEACQNLYEIPATTVAADPIVRHDGRTLFTSSGIQWLYPIRYEGKPAPEGPIYIEQPVIRTNYFEGVNNTSYTSFVNPGVFMVNASPLAHEAALTNFIAALQDFSPCGSEVSITTQETESDWDGNPFPVTVTRFSVDGLEVADAIYTPSMSVQGDQPISVSEFGLGLERLRTLHGDQLPFTSKNNLAAPALLHDSIRTMTLMAAAGVLPSNNNHGYQLRRFAKRLASLDVAAKNTVEDLSCEAYDYWSQFIKLPQDKQSAIDVLQQEYERNVGLRALQKIKEQTGHEPKVDVLRGLARTANRLRAFGYDETIIKGSLQSASWSVKEQPRRTLIVHDYENARDGYTFPNFSMGGIENGIWRLAVSAAKLDIKVIAAGPAWLPDYIQGINHFPERLNNPESVRKYLARYGRADYLYGGHEFFDKPEWVKPFKECADNLISFQHYPYKYKRPAYNGRDSFLFCASDEFMQMYQREKPIQARMYAPGVHEDPSFNENPSESLVWMGRLDGDKAPHLAIQAAKLANRDIRIMGTTSVQDPDYGEFIMPFLKQPHVEALGVLTGTAKMGVLTAARCAVYTVSQGFQDASPSIFGEFGASGIPIAGITWRGNDTACAAIDNPALGEIVDVRSFADDEKAIVRALAGAIERCSQIKHATTYEIGNRRYDPVSMVKTMLDIVDRRSSVSQKFV